MSFSVFTMLCNYHLFLVPKHFQSCEKETLYPLRSTPVPSFPQPLIITPLLCQKLKDRQEG